MKIRSLSNGALAVLLLCLYPSLHPAHAYLDPGTGSYAIQVGTAIFFTGLYSAKVFWKNIASKVKSLSSRKSR